MRTDGEILDESIGVDVESESIGNFAHAHPRRLEIEDSRDTRRLVSEHDVFGDGEDGDEHEVLVDHSNAGRHCVAGALELLNDSVEDDVALVRGVETVKDVHQRRLPCAVLAEQAVNLTGLHDQIDVVVGYERSETLRDSAKFQLH